MSPDIFLHLRNMDEGLPSFIWGRGSQRRGEGEGVSQKKGGTIIFQSTIDIHIQNIHKNTKITVCLFATRFKHTECEPSQFGSSREHISRDERSSSMITRV